MRRKVNKDAVVHAELHIALTREGIKVMVGEVPPRDCWNEFTQEGEEGDRARETLATVYAAIDAAYDAASKSLDDWGKAEMGSDTYGRPSEMQNALKQMLGGK